MKPIRFTAHAFERIFERGISLKDCEAALANSKVIESYLGDQPFLRSVGLDQRVAGHFIWS